MIKLSLIESARSRIAEHISSTPFVWSPSLSGSSGSPVGLKLEHRQLTGSFKIRGATNAVLKLSEAERARGVVAVSTGNYGRALSFAARAVGSRATICMSRLVPENKVAEIRRLGADVRIVGVSQDEAEGEVERLVNEDGLVLLPPFDHPDIIAGQGTVGFEIVEAMPDLTTVLVPVSGGGLAAGIAIVVKALRPRARVVGISMRRGAAMRASLDAGHPVQVKELRSFADALGGGIGLENRLTFPLCQALLDDLVVLDEGEIAAGIRHAYEDYRGIGRGRNWGPAGPQGFRASRAHGGRPHRCEHRPRTAPGRPQRPEQPEGRIAAMPSMKLPDERELRQVVSLDLAAVRCVEDAFRALAEEDVVMPPILRLDIVRNRGEVDVKTAYVPGLDGFAFKISPGFFDDRKLSLPSTSELIVLLDSRTGLLRAVLLARQPRVPEPERGVHTELGLPRRGWPKHGPCVPPAPETHLQD